MPCITNKENNTRLEINLLKNDYLDIVSTRTDTENWIPFELYFDNGEERIAYSVEDGATFSCYEIKSMLAHLEEIILSKSKGNGFERYEFSSSQSYFELVLYDPLEENEVYVELWINIGAITGGEIYGFDKGYRFVVSLGSMISFANDLKEQIEAIS